MVVLITIMMAAPMDGSVFCLLGIELGREKGFLQAVGSGWNRV